MLVTLVSAALAPLAVMEPTASDTSALSISIPPGSMRKKTKAIIGPNIRGQTRHPVHGYCAHAWTSLM